MVGAPAVTDGGCKGSMIVRGSSPGAERRMTSVGTPSSLAPFAPADVDPADAGTFSVLPGPAAARASSSELRLNSC